MTVPMTFPPRLHSNNNHNNHNHNHRRRHRNTSSGSESESKRTRGGVFVARGGRGLFLLLSILPALTSSLLDETALFDALDSDHDGTVSRSEYKAGVDKINSALLGGGGGGVGGGGGRVLEKQSDPNASANGGDAAGTNNKDNLLRVPPPPNHLVNKVSSPQITTDADENLGFLSAFTSSVAMILATEIGDKTFFIAAVLSMRNDRRAVFAGAILALVAMTILSTMMGLVLPSLLPRQYTHYIGGILFLYFGIRLVLESRSMAHKVSDELEEVEDELLRTRKKEDEEGTDEEGGGGRKKDTEKTNGISSAPSSGNSVGSHGGAPRKSESSISNASGYHGTAEQVFVQSLTLTFLAEWGDRSQIATIALAAAKDPYGVTIGGCVGHCICTGMAVVGGRMLAARISEKTVSLWGGMIFNVFGLHSIFFEA